MSARVLGEELGHPPAELRRRAAELLSRPPYREEPAGPVERAIGLVREWLAEALGRVLGTVAGDAALAWLVVAVGVAILLVVVWRSTRGLALDRAIDAAGTGEGTGRPAAVWEAMAEDHEAAGRWSEAVRCRYVGLVTRLVELGVTEEVPGRTVGELDRELAASAPALADAVAEAGEVFAEVVYGRRPADRARCERLRDLAALARRRAAAGGAPREDSPAPARSGR